MVRVMNCVKSGNRERSHRDRHKGCQIYSFVILENQRWRIPLGKYHSQWSDCVLFFTNFTTFLFYYIFLKSICSEFRLLLEELHQCYLCSGMPFNSMTR